MRAVRGVVVLGLVFGIATVAPVRAASAAVQYGPPATLTSALVGGDVVSASSGLPVREWDPVSGYQVGAVGASASIVAGEMGFEPSGVLDVFDYTTSTVVRVAADGTVLGHVNADFSAGVDSITFAPNGVGYIATHSIDSAGHIGARVIVRVLPDGSTSTFSLPTGLSYLETALTSLAVAPDGCTLYYSNGGRVFYFGGAWYGDVFTTFAVHRFDACQGVSLPDLGGEDVTRKLPTHPAGIALLADGSVVAADGPVLKRVAADGTVSVISTAPTLPNQYGSQEPVDYYDVSVDPRDGTLWAEQSAQDRPGMCFSDTTYNALVHLTLDGRVLGSMQVQQGICDYFDSVSVVPMIDGGTNPPLTVVDDGGGGGGPSVIQVGLGTSETQLINGQTATLTATADQAVDGSGYAIAIANETTGTLVGECGTGTTCTATVGWSPSNATYIAYVAPAGLTPQFDFVSASHEVEITPGWLLRADLIQNGQGMLLSVNQDMTGGPYAIEVFNTVTRTRVMECPVHKGCVFNAPAGADPNTYIAYLMPPTAQFPTPANRTWLLRTGVFWLPSGGNDGTGNPSEDCAGQPCTDDPVNPADGSLNSTNTDLTVPGRGLALHVTRSYSTAHASAPSRFGYGWSDNYQMALHSADQAPLASTALVQVNQENGTAVSFNRNANGTFSADPKVLATLTANADGTYTFVRRQTAVFIFDAYGKLLQQRDLHANTTSFSYDNQGRLTVVTDPAGRHLSYSYNNLGLVSAVTGPGGLSETYGYDTAGDLLTATDETGARWTYSYDANHELLSAADPTAVTTTNGYDDIGRVATQATSYGTTSYTYDPGTVTVRHPAGDVMRLHYVSGQLQSQTRGVGSPQQATWSYTYDPTSLQIATITDPLGRVTTMTYDARGNNTSLTDPAGHTGHFSYDVLSDRTSQTDPAGATTTWTYDSAGDLVASTDPTGATSTASYATNGDRLTATDALGHTTHYGYDSDGDLTTITDPAGHTATATYNSFGRPLSTTDANGHTTTDTLDPRGLITAITNPAGATTTYGYDAAGHRTSTTDATGRAATISYDAGGGVSRVTRPDGTFVSTGYDGNGRPITSVDSAGANTTYSYDALSRVTSVTDPVGATQTYSYDMAGNLASDATPKGGVTHFSYDASGRLSALIDPVGAKVSYTRDADGRVISTTDPNQHTSSYSYDANGQVTAVTRADGTVSHYTYNAAGQLTSAIDAAGNTTSYSYDVDGRTVTVTDPNGHSRQTSYDPAGQLATTTDPLGRVATYNHDPAGNLVGVAYSDVTPAVTYSYDAAGRRLTMADGSGHSTYTYDAAGRLATSTDGAGASVRDGYDSLGRLATLTYPDGRVVSYTYDADSRIATVTDGASHTTSFTYDADGNLVATAYPNGDTQTASFDPADRLTATTVSAGATTLASFGYQLGASGLVTSATATGVTPPSQSYSYTALDQLGGASSPNAGSYRYDPAGNLTGWPDGTTMAYDPAGQLKTMTTSGAAITTFGFDAAGERVSQTGPGTAASDCALCVQAASGTGVSASGTATVRVAGVITVNSASTSAVVASGSAKITAGSLHTNGTVNTSGTAAVTPAAKPGSAPDPLAGWTVPTTTTQRTPINLGGASTATAQPGVYSAITVAGNASLTLAPGVYVLTGPMSVGGSAKLTGTKATVYFACTNYPSPCPIGGHGGSLTVSGNARVTLTGGAAGANQGIALLADPANTSASTIGGSAALTVTGSVDLPAQSVTLSGTATATIDGGTTTVGQLTASGSAAVTVDTGTLGRPATTYSYNAAGELTALSNPNTQAAYTYNGDGLRTAAITNGHTAHYVWAAAQLLTDGGNDYIYGPAGTPIEQISASTGAASYLHADRLGSTRVITSSTGTVIGTASYDPYGQPLSQTGVGSRIGFAGAYTDSTNLLYLRARYEDPTTGQFLTVDPFVGATGTPYAYADNNPTNRTDPTGESSIAAGLKNGVAEFVITSTEGLATLATDPNKIINGLESVYQDNGGGLMGRAAVFDEFNPVSWALDSIWGTSDASNGGTAACTAVYGALQQAAFWAPGIGGEIRASAKAADVAAGTAVAVGDGLTSGAGIVVRTLSSGESVSDVFGELRQLTYETGQEHALVRLSNGDFQIQSGGVTGINFDPNVDQVLAHTHPYGLDAQGPSAADLAMLAQTSQRISFLLEHGDTILFGPDGTIAWH